MRIAIGQLWQESNTFNRNPTRWADFENWGIATGKDIAAKYGETGEIGGFLKETRTWAPEAEIVGLARFVCWPWGPVEAGTWQRIQTLFVEQLKAAGKVDAVFLALHGAMAAEGDDDVTGALLELVRREVGPDVPIVGSLDLHGVITERMLRSADVLPGYHACPHLDSAETGGRASKGLRRMLQEGVKPVTRWRKLPMFTAAESHNTFTGLPAPLYRTLEAWEREPDVLSAGLYMAMPWYDAADLGWTITLTTTSADPKWDRKIDALAEECWKLREPMDTLERFAPAEVVERALAHGGHPIVIGDGADATNSGCPGDGTTLLAEFLKRDRIPHGALTFLVDPESVAAAVAVGEGGLFDAPLGGRYAPEYSQPVRFQGTVEKVLDVKFILDGHISRNLPVHMGRGAVVRSGDVTVLLVEKNGPGSTPKLYEAAGLDPREFGIVVAKSPAGFRADYQSFAAGMLLADCPGCASPNWPRMRFDKAQRPLFPLDRLSRPEEAAWSHGVELIKR
jgi:microcystin degradation protein MlrC